MATTKKLTPEEKLVSTALATIEKAGWKTLSLTALAHEWASEIASNAPRSRLQRFSSSRDCQSDRLRPCRLRETPAEMGLLSAVMPTTPTCADSTISSVVPARTESAR